MTTEKATSDLEDLMSAERWEDAIAAAQAGLRTQPDDAELLWSVGWANVQLGRHEVAKPYLHKAAELGPVSEFRYWAFGVSLLETLDYDAAELWLLRALALRDTYRARIAVALVYHKQGMVEVAEAVHKEGLRLRPRHRVRMEAYADFLSDIGREEEANQMYDAARSLDAQEE